jgi:hypothetical protein
LRLYEPSTNGGNLLTNGSKTAAGGQFDYLLQSRRAEADAFYDTVIPATLSADEKRVMRQALAGMLWSKQYYYYDVNLWLKEHGVKPFRRQGRSNRNDRWSHMYNADIISMPDKWEYPWYAAWDLAFHVLALTMVDKDFGKEQLKLIVRPTYQHPSGQVPAYEWNFGDVNPPVIAWSTIFTYRLEAGAHGKGDLDWLERMNNQLLLNFNWWVNRKDRSDNNVFEGGFLGLDNIGVFDRSSALPTGGYLEQADGTAWMALFCQNMGEICVELALARPGYIDLLLKFTEHFLLIAASMVRPKDEVGMWDEDDGFFYDLLRFSDGRAERLKVRSMVGLLPLCAVTVFEGKLLRVDRDVMDPFKHFVAGRPELTATIHPPMKPGYKGRLMTSVLNEINLRRVLSVMLDEKEFLSPYGLRALSRIHAERPYVFRFGREEYKVSYAPGDSDSGLFGGNSNWRGPVWMPVNGLVIRALMQYYLYYGDTFKIECPTGSGRMMNLYQVAEELARRLASIFLTDKNGRRPVFGQAKKFQEDPCWKDYPLFYEYFNGDSGAGVGASHQTGWTGLIARLMQIFATASAEATIDQTRDILVHAQEPARQ